MLNGTARIVAALLLMALAITSCGDNTDRASNTAATERTSTTDHTTSTSTPAPTTTTVAPPIDTVGGDEQQVLDTVQAAWAATVAAAATADPTDPALAKYLTGAALERAVSSLQTLRDQGQVVRQPLGSIYTHELTIVLLDSSTALVRDCSVDDLQVIEASTGLIKNGEVVTRLISTTVVLVDDHWAVTDHTTLAEWDGVQACED